MSDGTSDGTRLAADMALPKVNPCSYPRRLTAVGNRLFFTACDAEHGRELWLSDGTDGGTVLVRDVADGLVDSNPDELVAAGDRLFFTAEEVAAGRELWVSDGTREGTVLVSDIRDGTEGSHPQDIVPCGRGILFTADDGIHGRELWRSDGTLQGTFLVQDFVPGPEGGRIKDLFAFGEEVYAYVEEIETGTSLWRILPSDFRLERVLDAATMRGDLDEVLATSRLSSTGAANTDLRGIPPEMLLLTAFFPPSRTRDAVFRRTTAPVRLAGDLCFVAHTRTHGAELWKTDGTVSGTRIVLDAFPGPPVQVLTSWWLSETSSTSLRSTRSWAVCCGEHRVTNKARM